MTRLTLKHYAQDAGMAFDPGYDYSTHRTRDNKPTGFWVSVAGERDWHEWCTIEQFATDSLANEYDVTLTGDARILLIDNRADLDALSHRYPAPVPEWRKAWDTDPYPDWERIAAEYDGIIIAPYQGGARRDARWYWGWDCASGCIWNLDAIASVTPVQQMAVTP